MKKVNSSIIKADKEHQQEACRKINTNGEREKNERK